MKFSTKLFAIASAIIMIASTSAYALIDMTDDVDDSVTVATEIDVEVAGTDIANDTNIFDVTSSLGFGQASGNTFYVRYDLSNGTFKVSPTSCTVVALGDAGTLSSGGAGESFAIYSVTATADRASTVDVLLVNNAAGVTMTDQSSVTVTYSMYETAGDAVAQTNALATDSEAMIVWGAALVASANTVASDLIDVTESSLKFDDTDGFGTDVTIIGNVDIGVDGTTLWTDGQAAAMADLVAAGTTLVLTGDFNAALASTNGVYIDAVGNNCDAVGTVSTETATTATFTLDTNAVDGTGGVSICMQVDEATAIGTGAITGMYTVVAGASSDVANQSLGTVTTLSKNGATDTLNFALKPTTAFTNLVRITNSGSVAGDVFITLINDAGDTATFELADVDGVASSTLASGASTAYINISALYDAAQVAEPTFDNDSGQLRVNIDSTCTEIIVNGIAMSKDNNVFTVIDSVDDATN